MLSDGLTNFQGLDGSTNSSYVTAIIEGIYDDEEASSAGRWYFNATTYNTLAEAVASAGATWQLHTNNSYNSGSASDGSQFTDGRYQCASSSKECWQSYNQTWSITLPVCMYDYLPYEICTISGGGSNTNIGAR